MFEDFQEWHQLWFTHEPKLPFNEALAETEIEISNLIWAREADFHVKAQDAFADAKIND